MIFSYAANECLSSSKIKFFRPSSALHIQCPPNTPVGSASSESPNVRHRSREELLCELVDQGYNVYQYKR